VEYKTSEAAKRRSEINKKNAAKNPLPIDALRSASKDVEEGRFHPEREKEELTRALGNDEHPGRT
jgi:hypothetical protein